MAIAPPYPGAKPYYLIGAQLDDQVSITRLIERTASELQAPRPKKQKQGNPK